MFTRLLPLSALLLIACQPGEPDPAGKPQGPLRRCIGEAAYSQESWDQLMRDLSTHSLRCPENQAGDPDVPIMLNLGPGEEAVAGDSVRIHGFVMDAACDPVADYRRTQSLTPGSTSVLPVWDGRDDQGNLVRTGEYYVNLELEWKDGSRDTTYHKVGYVRYNCPGVVR